MNMAAAVHISPLAHFDNKLLPCFAHRDLGQTPQPPVPNRERLHFAQDGLQQSEKSEPHKGRGAIRQTCREVEADQVPWR